jgi:hypothetical protein
LVVRHPENCRLCKETVFKLLEKIYGQVISQYSLDLPARPEEYRGSFCYDDLARIHQALQEYRGHRSFVRARTLPRVDYYVPSQRLVVEYDESQHFTKPRLITLRLYPASLGLGFDRHKWMDLAARLDRHDNDPIYRDEQRAWYDTLRDFSSAVVGNAPTARLFASDREWCRLNPDGTADVARFEACLMNDRNV